MEAQTDNEALMQTDLQIGLDTQEVQKRLTALGYNEVPEKKENPWLRVGKRFWGIVPWMLEVTAIITFILGEYPQAGVILTLLIFNAVISLWREGKAKAAMATLKQKLTIQSRVKRDGKWLTIPARELVTGDIVRVRIGDLLPADIKIIEGALSLDQSILTGESEAVERSAGGVAYSGSAIKRGEATGIVYATGAKTYFGKTISLLELAKPKLHMEEVTLKVARSLGIIVLASLLIVFVYAGFTGFGLEVLLPLAGVLLIATVPVAMPMMFTLNMALGSLSLAKQGVLITRLSAGEDAATMDVLCVDKTGTITLNKLFVEEKIPLNGYNANDVLLYGALASKEANQDPIDIAFLTDIHNQNISLESHAQLEFIPFNPKTRMTEAKIQQLQEKFHVAKGSFDSICTLCNTEQQQVQAALILAEALSEKGLRVIAVAKGEDRSKLHLIGLVGIADRIREDSHETLQQIRALGIEVKMLTGDSLPVAKSIAGQLGLGNVTSIARISQPTVQAIHYDALVKDNQGIAQVYPEDKYEIVKTLQDSQHVVGMTGDGVNDAPALSQAEVGIAVKNATDIAKDSASAVLTVEGLKGIIPLIHTSRTVYQKVHSWTLMMVTRKLHISFFIVFMLFLTHSLILSITSTLLVLFLADFATMAMSTDNVRASIKPDKFRMRVLFGTGLSLGILMTIEGLLFAVPTFTLFNITSNIGQVYTFGFVYFNFVGLFVILSLREQSYFWASKPSKFLIITITIEFILVFVIAILGILELTPLSIPFVLATFTYAFLTTLLINDPIKVQLIHRFKIKS